MNASTPWVGVIPDEDLEIFRVSGHGSELGWGEAPALVIVDTTLNFVGTRPQPILESIAEWPYSCGPAGWEAISSIQRILSAARLAGIPVVYTTGIPPGSETIGPGRWADKTDRAITPEQITLGHSIPDEIKPCEGELVLRKEKPSAFFGTPLAAYLMDQAVESLIVCGGATSGCVRATVTDAFSYNLRVAIPAEATFDRSQTCHVVSLFDLHQKYADVVTENDVIEILGR